MPTWFWETPIALGSLAAVGYARRYDDLAASYREAFEDAARRLISDRRCRIRGGRATAWEGSAYMSFGAAWSFEADTSDLASFSVGLNRVDSAVAGDLVVMLVSTRPMDVDRKLRLSPPPGELGSRGAGDVLHGVGAAPSYYHPASSWIEAERLGRIDAAVAGYCRVKGIQAHADELAISTVVTETDVTLTGVQTIRRACDPAKGVVWVLIAAHQLLVTSPSDSMR